jgi:hypothetical protein
VPGYEPPNHAENCRKNPDQVEFWYPTGYRRIPLTTCQGGQELDKVESQACPGHEQEYEKKHGISGAALFFAITVPLAAAAGVGYWVYTRWQAGFAGFGQIRLGESMAGATGGSGESPLISIPVAVVSAIVAVVKATPLLIMSIWRNAKGYMPLGSGGGGGGGRFGIGRDAGAGYGAPYRSRDAFARRGQDYSQVVEDDELLGDGLDDEEEV